MDLSTLRGAFARISATMAENRQRLIELDQRNGDGDLGISMDDGYRAVSSYLAGAAEADLGKLFMRCSSVFNESAPSSLGTITSIFLMAMAKSLKGKTEASLAELAAALDAGLSSVMEKAKSKPGEKTILDSVHPAVMELASQAARAGSASGAAAAWAAAAAAAEEGCERTKEMRSVHGRAAYYGDKSLGIVDGGAVVGALIFRSVADYLRDRA